MPLKAKLSRPHGIIYWSLNAAIHRGKWRGDKTAPSGGSRDGWAAATCRGVERPGRENHRFSWQKKEPSTHS